MSPRRLVVLFIALMLSLPLAAGTLRVGLLADGELEGYASGLLDSLFTLMPRVGRLEVVNYNRHQEAEARRQATSVHEAYAAEREVAASTPAAYVPYYESSPTYEIVPLSAQTAFIDSLDEAMLSHLSRDLDLVFVFLDSPRDSLGGLEVWLYIEGRLSPIFSSLYVPGSLDGLSAQVLAAMASFFVPSLCVLDSSAFPSSRLLDGQGNEIPMASSFALVDAGATASVTVTGGGMADLAIPVDCQPGQVCVLSGGRLSLDEETVTLTAHPTGVRARLFGLDVQLPLTTSFQADSLVLSLSAPGFDNAEIQLSGQGGFQSFTLKPQWMGSEALVMEAKDGMYRAMRNALLSFGLYVVTSSLATIYPETALWLAPVSTLGAGIGVVNLIDFIHDMLAYYDRAKDVYL